MLQLSPEVSLERLVPLREVSRLSLHGIVICLDAQEGAHPAEQFPWIQGSSDEIVGTGLDRVDLVLIAARGQHDHREQAREGIVAYTAADLVSRDVGHKDVKENDIRVFRPHLLEAFLARVRTRDEVSLLRQDRLEEQRVFRRVVDDQQARSLIRGRVPSRSRQARPSRS